MRRMILLLCMAALTCVPALVAAQPEFALIGEPVDMGNGEFEFEYKLTNFGGAVPIYDLEFEYSIAAAWIRVNGPDNWAMNWEGPLWRWQTDSAPCQVETELYGFYIYAGGPQYSMSPLTFTDQGHMVVASSEALLPVPEPGSLAALGSGMLLLAGGIIRRRR